MTESHRGRTPRNKHAVLNVPFVNIGAQIILHTLLLDDFPTNFMLAQFSLPIKTKRYPIANLQGGFLLRHDHPPGGGGGDFGAH